MRAARLEAACTRYSADSRERIAAPRRSCLDLSRVRMPIRQAREHDACADLEHARIVDFVGKCDRTPAARIAVRFPRDRCQRFPFTDDMAFGEVRRLALDLL